MGKENQLETTNCEVNDHNCPSIKNDEEVVDEVRYSTDGDSGLPICRVCQCAESDRRGDTALGILGITPPLPEAQKTNASVTIDVTKAVDIEQKNPVLKMESGFIETVNHDGEAFIYTNDIELGIWEGLDSLLELGCSCKNDLALVHYACALKWFLNHGSTVCEICGHVAENINQSDLNKVIVALRGRLADEDPNALDQDTVVTVRKQRLSEISSWFGPYQMNNNNGGSNVDSQAIFEQPLAVVNFGIIPTESRATKWAVEGTGILLATGLLTVTLVWLIAPRVGKKTATSGVHILLGGLCALTVVIFFRFVVLTRIKYGPARYWAILFIFWFLVFGIWASRSNASHTNH